MTNGTERRGIETVWRKLDVAHYYDRGEIAILRAYFGLKPRTGDPALASLYEEPDDDGTEALPHAGPIRLHRFEACEPATELTEAVARICLSGVQERLPQWAACCGEAVVLGRAAFASPDRTFTPLNAERLLCINWADSGPGFSWPEDYFVTLLPGFGRYVVTASADSTDAYGVTDFALGWFRTSEGRLVGSRRILLRWWRRAAECGGGPWASLFQEGLVDSASALRLRRRAWIKSDERSAAGSQSRGNRRYR
jgi:hypothetical protein